MGSRNRTEIRQQAALRREHHGQPCSIWGRGKGEKVWGGEEAGAAATVEGVGGGEEGEEITDGGEGGGDGRVRGEGMDRGQSETGLRGG